MCALKVAEGRRVELVDGMDTWKSTGGGVLLLTLTFRHARSDELDYLVERFADAQARLYRSAAWKVARDVYEIVGRVSALEVTHGEENGWHPHRHSLLFTRAPLLDVQQEALKRLIFSEWARCCEAVGLGRPTRARGVDVRNGQAAGEYVAKFGADKPTKVKWGADAELARAHTKRGRGGNRSPWDLLRIAHDAKHPQAPRATALFKEYASRFRGRRQLVWSRGMRDRLGLGAEKSDEELAAELAEGGGQCMAVLPPKVWKAVVRRELRGQLLAVAARGDPQAVREWLYDLRVFDGPVDDRPPDEIAERRKRAALMNGPPSAAEDLFHGV